MVTTLKMLLLNYAWNLITKEFQISGDKLSVSVYSEDKEAYDLWKKIAGLPENRIYKISTNDNFWSMGETSVLVDLAQKYFMTMVNI